MFAGRRGLVGLFVNKLIRRQGSADRIPVIPLSFIRERERTSSKLERRNAMKKEQVVHLARRKAGAGNDESRKKDRQAFQEWLRERRSVHFRKKDY